MAKPYICGDTRSVYVPDVGCECNYLIKEYSSEEYETTYTLEVDGDQRGAAINIPKQSVDLVVEKGVSAEFTYRKWSSGISECWGDFYFDSTAGTTTGGVSGLYGLHIADQPFPEGLFLTKPVVTASCRWGTGYNWGNISGVTETLYQMFIFKTSSNAAPGHYRIYAIGRWK